MGVAITKASARRAHLHGRALQHAAHEGRRPSAGFFWLLIMFGLTMGDYMSRSWLGVPGR
jgi:hypothetical protein